jgi:hypothetical protein
VELSKNALSTTAELNLQQYWANFSEDNFKDISENCSSAQLKNDLILARL